MKQAGQGHGIVSCKDRTRRSDKRQAALFIVTAVQR